ncbi:MULTISPECIES: hypothetical protein [unclassified Luteimonas]
MNATQYDEMVQFLEKATLLAATLERRCEDAAQQSSASARDLGLMLQRVEGEVGSIVSAGRDELLQHAETAVRQAIAREVGMATAAIGESARELQRAADQLGREQAMVGGRMRAMAWKSIVAVGAAAFLTIAGSSFIVWNNAQRIQHTQVQADVLEALRHVTVTSCDGRPCMKLAQGQPRWSKNADYILVDVSAPAGDQAAR